MVAAGGSRRTARWRSTPSVILSTRETSSSGRDKPKAGASDAVAPGTFAQLVAKANKKLKFDAWAHHPYPLPVNQKPTQKVRYPNVTLTSFPEFEKDLDAAFGRKNIPLWVTEYGHETKPGEPKGVMLNVGNITFMLGCTGMRHPASPALTVAARRARAGWSGRRVGARAGISRARLRATGPVRRGAPAQQPPERREDRGRCRVRPR